MELCYLFFFFFQAEDGIRDYKVTGVQTCALPILGAHEPADRPGQGSGGARRLLRAAPLVQRAASPRDRLGGSAAPQSPGAVWGLPSRRRPPSGTGAVVGSGGPQQLRPCARGHSGRRAGTCRGSSENAFSAWLGGAPGSGALRRASVLDGVGLELNRLPVGLDQPEMPLAIVLEQASVLHIADLPRPDHLGMVDVRGVVHPLDLPAGVICRSIANEDQMLA